MNCNAGLFNLIPLCDAGSWLLADLLALQNVLTSILLLPCPYFLRSGLLWHGLTLRLADWLSSPLANDGGGSLSSSCTSPSSPSLPPSLPLLAVRPAADNTRRSTRHHQKIPPFLLVLPVSNDHAIYCICKCIWIRTRSGILSGWVFPCRITADLNVQLITCW